MPYLGGGCSGVDSVHGHQSVAGVYVGELRLGPGRDLLDDCNVYVLERLGEWRILKYS